MQPCRTPNGPTLLTPELAATRSGSPAEDSSYGVRSMEGKRDRLRNRGRKDRTASKMRLQPITREGRLRQDTEFSSRWRISDEGLTRECRGKVRLQTSVTFWLSGPLGELPARPSFLTPFRQCNGRIPA